MRTVYVQLFETTSLPLETLTIIILLQPTGNIDNHNPSLTLSCESFHGTALSITQQTTNENASVVIMHMETAHNRSVLSISVE